MSHCASRFDSFFFFHKKFMTRGARKERSFIVCHASSPVFAATAFCAELSALLERTCLRIPIPSESLSHESNQTTSPRADPSCLVSADIIPATPSPDQLFFFNHPKRKGSAASIAFLAVLESVPTELATFSIA